MFGIRCTNLTCKLEKYVLFDHRIVKRKLESAINNGGVYIVYIHIYIYLPTALTSQMIVFFNVCMRFYLFLYVVV